MKNDDFYMGLAQYVTAKSKDPSTKVGAVIVNQHYQPVSYGTNGFARGVPDLQELLDDRESKLRLTIHAEENAIIFAARPLDGCIIYVWPMMPCSTCMAKIVQSRISRVVTLKASKEQEERWGKDFRLSLWQAQKAGVVVDFLDQPGPG